MSKLSRLLGRGKFWFKKNKAGVFTYTGLTITAIGAGLAVKQTLKHSEELKTESTKAEKAKTLVKTYALPATAYVAGNTLVVLGHKDAKKQVIATNAALAATTATLNTFYENVKREVGDEKASDLYHNRKKTEEVTVNEDGTKTVETIYDVDPSNYSIYSKVFDQSNCNWEKSAEANMDFLLGAQRWATRKLELDGYLFLNDVYRELGFPITKAGQIAGWIYDKDDPNIDEYVDFGMFHGRQRANDFINGYEPCIILDFNCQGNIMDDARMGLFKF